MDFILDNSRTVSTFTKQKYWNVCMKFNMRLYSEYDLLWQPVQKIGKYYELIKDDYSMAQYQN